MPEAASRVKWFPCEWYDTNRTDVTVFVAWRYSLSIVLGKSAQIRYLWLHDLVDARYLPSVGVGNTV